MGSVNKATRELAAEADAAADASGDEVDKDPNADIDLKMRWSLCHRGRLFPRRVLSCFSKNSALPL
jgi:hypothetical protein